ncbi:cyclic nucleotide-binding family protein [Listeria grandensis FSL F6-0971]|uniref:Cyclic nucleotide-binding family protein n=1 Tax=Listeria grandensis FSL F6-0971 TaxID=1265819 RepID=W7BFY9_9LIST|nr:cyclic nucleotide-binding family protein [Listeria grandensis FSL F6-0971]
MYSLTSSGFHPSPNYIELPTFTSYDVLADMANVSKSLVSLVCKALREDGMLVSSQKPWAIIDVKKFVMLLEQEEIPINAAK